MLPAQPDSLQPSNRRESFFVNNMDFVNIVKKLINMYQRVQTNGAL